MPNELWLVIEMTIKMVNYNQANANFAGQTFHLKDIFFEQSFWTRGAITVRIKFN